MSYENVIATIVITAALIATFVRYIYAVTEGL